MTQTDFRELLSPARFRPFVVTLIDGFSLEIGDFQQEHIIAAAHLFVTMDTDGNLIHVPYAAIARIQEPQ